MLISLCQPASLPGRLTATCNGIHVLCLIPTIVEKCTASGGQGECRPSPKISNGLQSSLTPCHFIKLGAMHCQESQNEACSFSVYSKTASKHTLHVIPDQTERERGKKHGCVSLLRQFSAVSISVTGFHYSSSSV